MLSLFFNRVDAANLHSMKSCRRYQIFLLCIFRDVTKIVYTYSYFYYHFFIAYYSIHIPLKYNIFAPPPPPPKKKILVLLVQRMILLYRARKWYWM